MPQRPISDDEIQRVSSYMLGQAEKYSEGETVRDRLTNLERLMGLIGEVNADA